MIAAAMATTAKYTNIATDILCKSIILPSTPPFIGISIGIIPSIFISFSFLVSVLVPSEDGGYYENDEPQDVRGDRKNEQGDYHAQNNFSHHKYLIY